MYSHKGFTLLELMVVVAIMAFLAMISIPGLMKVFSKAKRTEAYVNLRSLYMAEKAYCAERGSYTTEIQSLGWTPGSGCLYTYGFPGTEGLHYISGSAKTPATALSQAYAHTKEFCAYAVCDIDEDGVFDMVSIDQDGVIKVVQDDLI